MNENECTRKPTTSRTSRLAAFDKLYNENKTNIHMKKHVNYPLNYKKGIKWAQYHCDAESNKFAESIIANTIYVSFAEFIKQLEKVCKAFKHYYEKKKDTTFVMIIPFTMKKSNVWVSLLVYPWLRELIHDIQFNVTNAYNEYVAKQGKSNVVCFICDDCAYTGNQVMSYCSLTPNSTVYKNKPEEPPATSPEWLKWNKLVKEETEVLEKTIQRDTFSVNLLIPYMSTLAQQNAIDHHFLMIPRDIKIFRLFRESVNMHEYNQGIAREFESSFQYHTNISAIYFDHKIADAISTFNKVFLLAPIFNCGTLKRSLCFIDGCCNKKTISDNVDIYDVHVNVEDLIKDACPPTFYKAIDYTLNKKKLGDQCIFDILNN
jgi:hypothetical protein